MPPEIKACPVRILIADDHAVMREGIRSFLEREPDWEVCGTARNGREAVEMAKEFKPEIAILDLTMPELDGLEALRQIKRTSPKTEVMIFSAYHSEKVIEELFGAGAKSYIQKSDAPTYLVQAIKTLLQRRPFFTPEISDVLFSKFSSPGARELTDREREVVRLLAEGSSNKEIATALEISVRTVETHRATLLRKLGLDSLAGLVRYAIRNYIIEP